jgi:uncharacterized protein (TIGR02300 family)
MTAVAMAARGTKRHCQNDQCGHPFYDLNRSEIACPYCGSGYVPVVVVPSEPRRPSSRQNFRSGPAARPLEIVADDAPEAVEIEVETDGEAVDASEALLDDDDSEDPGAIDVIPTANGDED